MKAALTTSEERYRILFETAPMAVFVCDRDAVIQTYNRQAAELWGREPRCGVEKHCGSMKLWLPDGTVLPHAQSPIVEVLRTGAPVRGVEVSIERPDGSKLPVLVNFSALTDAAGEVTGAITTFVDITERKRAEEDRGRLAAIVASSQDAIILHSLDGIILDWNGSAERIFGYPAAKAIGQPMTMLLPADVADALPRQIEAIQRGEPAPARAEVLRLNRSGQQIDLSILISPVYDAKGRLIAASTVARDVSDLSEKEAHQEMLLHELSHRVKNTLATVQAIAMQTLNSAPDPEAFQTAFQARLAALSHAHGLLMQSNWHGAALRELVDRSLAPYRNGRQPQWTLEGKDIEINPKATLALGMVFHELATNAAKYGALSKPAGCVEVQWHVKRDDTLHLTWAERDGPRVEKPERRGFGSRLIEDGLNYELDADVQLAYKPTGLRCTFDVALEAVTLAAGGDGDEPK